MAQVKKTEVRDAILRAAFELFVEKDYARTTVAEIARRAGVSQSNIYVYFSSKLEILWAVMSPWLFRQFELLELELSHITEPQARIERLLMALWGDIPAADNCLAVNLIQGLALTQPGDRYSRDLLRFLETRVTRILRDSLPPERWHLLEGDDALAHLIFMAFDGFVLGARVKGRSERLPQIVRIKAALLMEGVIRPEAQRLAEKAQ
ncbi:MAG: TetR/AcrR family transcriptional regulator [Pararhodobacter sp.]|nr:TetR/AcrR family transcriptional regulator [Pararhodobacter sp.]